jgi:hypothetical protein
VREGAFWAGGVYNNCGLYIECISYAANVLRESFQESLMGLGDVGTVNLQSALQYTMQETES